MRITKEELQAHYDLNEDIHDYFMNRFYHVFSSIEFKRLVNIQETNIVQMSNRLVRKYFENKLDTESFTGDWLDTRNVVYYYILEQLEYYHAMESL